MINQNITTLIFIALIAAPLLCKHDISEEFINSKMDRLDRIFSKIPGDKILDHLMTAEKRKLLFDLLDASPQHVSKKEDPEAHFYTPRQPEPLASQEKNIYKRIEKKYIGEIPSQVKDIIYYFSHFDECQKNNIIIYNRLLLNGVPGTGKSHLFKVLAQELQVPYLSFSASFFADKYIGESSRRIRRAFQVAKELNSPMLIFIDEIDALATKRNGNTHEEQRATLITLLTELQDLQGNKNIFIIAATNDLKSLDPAIKDRFAGAICEIKELEAEHRANLFKKVFADRGVIIDDAFAQRLAKVTSAKTTGEEDETIQGDQNEKKQKKYVFSNRDIEYIVTTALLKQFADCTKKCSDPKVLSKYIREAIDATKKRALFSLELFQAYANGI
jgi:SpoVK/Ycf46/Vps4 family AAA+-type ATPase